MKQHYRLTFLLALLVTLLSAQEGWGQTNPTAHNLSASNYTFTGFGDGTTTTYPTSMQGWNLSAEPGNTFVGPGASDRALSNSTSSIGTGSIRNEVGNGISLLNSSTNNIGAIVVAINATGRENVRVTWTAADMVAVQTRVNGIKLQYRIGTSGDFTDVASSTYLSENGSAKAAQTFTDIALPVAVNDEAVVQVRWLYFFESGTGSRDRIRIDDITIASDETVIGSVDNPASFTATAATASQINLAFELNDDENDVVIAFNSSNTFGEPTGTYSATDPITGGGTVLYVGAASPFNHTGLTGNTQYFYKAWSVDGSEYSGGLTANATTFKSEPAAHVTDFDVSEGVALTLTWESVATADGYLIIGSNVGFGS